MFKRILRYAFSFPNNQSQKKMYVLSQFPYPSGDLHLGHARVYFIGDSIATYYRLKSHHVIYPIGWDSFGLPAENAAIVHGQNPKAWTESNIERMKQQLYHLKINFNWEMELSTCSPEYYRWTQEIFVKMFKKGLAYKKMAEVNWDPIDKTVLANQQVDENGFSWRSGAKVQKKMLSQWFLKITEYAEQLQQNLSNLQWIQKVKNMQRGWIDFRKGYRMNLQLKNLHKEFSSMTIEIFIQNAQSLQSAKFIIKKNNQTKEDTIHGYVQNPYNNELIPVIHSASDQSQNYILVGETDIKNHQHYNQILAKSNLKKGETKNAGFQSKDSIFLENSQQVNQMKLKDWLISRQRFWGCPIPIAYCKNCGTVPVPQDQLPVILPQWNNDGNPLLKDSFKKCTCPQCGTLEAQRESDTMDTFVDSSWYFLRFMDSKNPQTIFSKDKVSTMMPVDIYIGGIEHAIMHLLYARFIMRFIQRQYELPHNCIEPFKQLVVQGLVKGKTLALKENGKYIAQKDIDSGKYSMQEVRVTYQKMSKSKFNGLNPNTLVDKFGSDALRVAIFFANPPDRDVDFSEQIVVNAQKFLHRIENIWKQLSLLPSALPASTAQLLPKEELLKLKNIFEKMEISIQKRLMHTYVAHVMEMFNLIKDFLDLESKKIESVNKVRLFTVFVRVLRIVAPELSSELQMKLMAKYGDLIKKEEFERWPSDELFGEKIEIFVMKGKKMVAKETVDIGSTDEQIAKELNLEGKVQQIKRQKKKFILILKED